MIRSKIVALIITTIPLIISCGIGVISTTIKDDGFSGGIGNITTHDLQISRSDLELKTDSLSSNHINKLYRLFHSYGYDKGDFRSYFLLYYDSLYFDIRLYENEKGRKGKANFSAVGVKYIKYKNYKFNPSQELSNEDKIAQKKILSIIEEKYINLLK